MTYLCMQLDTNSQIVASEVATANLCNGYIADMASNYGLAALTFTDANELLSATAELFAVAFIFRLLIRFILNR